MILAPGLSADAALLAPLSSYAHGHATGDPAHFRVAFRPTAHIEGIREGRFVSWSVDEYCSLFTGPASDESSRRRTVTELRSYGSIAHATIELEHGADRFTDVFLLVEEDGAWLIANKVYVRHP